MLSKMSAKLPLPSFITASNNSNETIVDEEVVPQKTFWPCVPAVGRKAVYEESERNYTPPRAKDPNFNVWEVERVKECNLKVNEFHAKAFATGNRKDWEALLTAKRKLQNAIRAAKVQHRLKTEPAAQCMMPHYCDCCDRGFKTVIEYDSHCREHVKCEVDGCEFIGHPKVVILHHKMQHVTGLAQKIMSVKTKEEMKKWISDRKKNYPTVANVTAKKMIMEERRKRGQFLKTKEFGKMQKRKRHKGANRKIKSGGNMSGNHSKLTNNILHDSCKSAIEDDRFSIHGIPRFCGRYHEQDEEIAKSPDNMDIISTGRATSKNEERQSPLSEHNSLSVDQSTNQNTGDECRKNTSNDVLDESNDKEEPDLKNELFLENPSNPSDQHKYVKSNSQIGSNLSIDSSQKESSSGRATEHRNVSTDTVIPKFVHETANIEQALLGKCSEKTGDPMSYLISDTSGSDDDGPSELPIGKKTPKFIESCQRQCGALASLMASYDFGSSSDDDACHPPVAKRKKITRKAVPQKLKIDQKWLWNPDKMMKKIQKHRPSLLEKMLAKEIRHERNIILQCVKYIVQSNYFSSSNYE